MDLNLPQEALPLLQSSIARAPSAVACYCNLATVLKILRRFDEALAAARRAVELAPNEPATHLPLASVLLAIETGRGGAGRM